MCARYFPFFSKEDSKTRRRQANPNQAIAMPLAEAHLPDFTGMLFYSTSTMRILGKALDLGSERGEVFVPFFSILMLYRGLLDFLSVFLLTSVLALADPPITDPVADYLAMNVPDRMANVGRLLVIKKVEIDLEGNGKDDVFVGTWYRNSGPDTWLWTGYAPVAGGYHRITPADSDVLIDFDGIYVGYLPDFGRNGMAQAYSLELNNKDRDQSNIISDLTFYYMEAGQLMQTGTGALDRDDPEQEAKFEYYFGPERKSPRAPRIQSLTVLELAQQGYRIPLWRAAAPPGTK
jgi:hypothetical protein